MTTNDDPSPADLPVGEAVPASPPGGRVAGRLLRDSTVYLIGNLLQKAAAFVLLPIYTNYLTTLQYGLLELANTVVNLTLVSAALGVPYAINKCYHRDCRDDEARRRLASTALIFSIIGAGGIALVGWLFEGRLAPLIFSSPEGPLVYRYTLIWLVLAQVAAVPFELLRATGRSLAYVGLSVAQLSVQSGLVVYLVGVAGFGLRGVLIGNIAGFLAVNAVACLLLARRITWTFDPALLRGMIAYGLAIIPVFVSSWIVDLSDRFFLQSMVGLGMLGVYALGYKFGTLVSILLGIPLQRAWTPIFFAMADEERAPRSLARVATYFFLAGTFCSLAISLAVVPFLRLTAAPAFRGASGIVPLVCLAYLLAGLANCLGNGLIVAGKVRLLGAFAGAAAGTNLVLNALLIPWLGIYGAAIATVSAFATQLGWMLHALRRRYPVPIEWGRIAGIFLAGGAPYAASLLLPALSPFADAGIRILLLAAFPLLIVALRVVTPDEMSTLREGIGLGTGGAPEIGDRSGGGKPSPEDSGTDLSWLPPRIAAAVRRARRGCLERIAAENGGRDPDRLRRAGEAIDYHLREYRTALSALPSDPLRAMTRPIAGEVLDVGCGFGQTLLALGRTGTSARLVGVDHDRDALLFGEMLAREDEFAAVRPVLLAADALDLPFADHRFDLVICRDLVMMLPARRAVRELARMVASGGRLYIHEVGAGFYVEEVLRGRWRGALLALANGTLLRLCSLQVRIGGRWNNFASQAYLRRALRREGLIVESLVPSRTRWGLLLNVRMLATRPREGDGPAWAPPRGQAAEAWRRPSAPPPPSRPRSDM